MNSSFERLLDSLPDPVARFDLNLKLVYANKAFTQNTVPPQSFYGKDNLEMGMEPRMATAFMAKLKKVAETGLDEEMTATIETNGKCRTIFTKIVPERDDSGGIISLLAIGRDVTALKKAQESYQRTALILETLNEACYELDADGRIVYINKKAEQLFKKERQELIGRTIWEVFPSSVNAGGYEAIQVHALEKKQFFQTEYISSVLGRWISLSATPTENGCIVLFHEIEDLKQAGRKLQENAALLKAVFDGTAINISVSMPVYGETGQITDFRYSLVNSALVKSLGLNPSGKLWSEAVSSPVKDELLDKLIAVMTTGTRLDIVHRLEDGSKWYRITAQRTEEFLLVTSEDITRYKKAEEEIRNREEKLHKSESLLREAEKIGKMGSWECNFKSGELYWSDELFRIYGLDPNSIPPSTDYFLDYVVHPEDRKSVADSLNRLYRQYSEEPYSYRIKLPGGEDRVVFSKPQVVRDMRNQPVLVRGIIRDITYEVLREEVRIEEELEQQKELLHTVLLTEEKERMRIGEAIHNSLAQLLYAAKLRLEKENSLTSPEGIHPAIKMLQEAIKETRTIAFELMPSLIKDFGIKAGIRELIEKKANQSGIQFSVNYSGSERRYDLQDEVAVFRIIQELLNNTIKHSGAHAASTNLAFSENKILIQYEDNGIGFDIKETFENGLGFGLLSIKNRVELMNGEFSTDSEPGKGSRFTVSLSVKSA